MSSESHPYLPPGTETSGTVIFIPVLDLLKFAPLPWQKQNELIKCLLLAHFGNFMECVKTRKHFRPSLITSHSEGTTQAWQEGEEANPWLGVINIVMLLLIGAEKQLFGSIRD